jgi:hypothetical protein
MQLHQGFDQGAAGRLDGDGGEGGFDAMAGEPLSSWSKPAPLCGMLTFAQS